MAFSGVSLRKLQDRGRRMAKGDHIRVRRGVYFHHGIDCGDGRVIHYNGSPLRRRDAKVACTSMDEFSRGCPIEVVHACPPEDADTVLERAFSRLGESLYNLFRNNCEHFAWWCVTGKGRSHQVEKVVEGMATLVAATFLGVAALTVTARRVTSRA
jgi:hypothetical protein